MRSMPPEDGRAARSADLPERPAVCPVITVLLPGRAVVAAEERRHVAAAEFIQQSVLFDEPHHQFDLACGSGSREIDQLVDIVETEMIPMRSHDLADTPGTRFQRGPAIDLHRRPQQPVPPRLL